MPSNLISRFAAIEQKLDTILFRRQDDPDARDGGTIGTAAKGAAIAGGGLYAGSAAKRAIAPMVADRRSGLRATVPGFTAKSNLTQTIAATGSALAGKPLQAAGAIGNTVASDAKSAIAALKASAAGKGFVRARAGGSGVLGALRRGLGGATAAATRGQVRFSASTRLVALAEKLN